MSNYKPGSTKVGTRAQPPLQQTPHQRTSRTKFVTGTIAASAALTLLASCSGTQSDAPPPAPITATTSSATPTAAWDDASRAAAQKAGEKLLTTWARPQLAYEQWWADLKPLMSTAAQESYSYTDPANVPPLQITGPGVLSDSLSPYLVTVTFPTTEGEFGVDMSRTKIPGKWITENIIFPGDSSRLQG